MLSEVWEAIKRLEARLDALEKRFLAEPKTEGAAAQPAELPEVGSVWGVPGKPETWRKVLEADTNSVRYGCFGHGTYKHRLEDWSHFIKSSGAVRIDGEVERVAALEAENARLRVSLDEIGGDYNEAKEEAVKLRGERDDARAAISRLLEALRGIDGEAGDRGFTHAGDMYASLSRISGIARKAIKREKGVN